MSTRSNVGQSTIGEMGVGADTVSSSAVVVGTTTVTATPTGVVVSSGRVVGTTTAVAEIFRLTQRINLSGEVDTTIQLQ